MYKVEGKPSEEYLSDDGVQLVNSYAALHEDFKRISDDYSSRLLKLKEALVKYAQKHKASSVFRSNVKANVAVNDVLKFPGKNDSGADELRLVLKKLGIYDEVSMVDNYRLIEMVKNGELEKDVLKKLKKFERVERSESVRLCKLKEE